MAWPVIAASRTSVGSGSPSAMRSWSSNQVQAGDCLGDRMLDLQPGVHLQEVERPVAVQDELDGARAGVADRPAGGDGCRGERGAELAVDGRGRGLLHDLLVAALDGALALEQVDHVAVGVAEDLHLDVARVRDVALQEHGAVAERGGGLAARGADRGVELRGVADQPHTTPAAAERRLDQQRETDRAGCGVGVGVKAASVDGHAGQHRDARRGHRGLGGYLVTHRLDRRRGRADEDQAGVGAGPGERGVLGQEPVTGMDGPGAGGGGRGDDQVTAQVGVGGRRSGQPDRLVGHGYVGGFGVRVGVDRDGGDA